MRDVSSTRKSFLDHKSLFYFFSHSLSFSYCVSGLVRGIHICPGLREMLLLCRRALLCHLFPEKYVRLCLSVFISSILLVKSALHSLQHKRHDCLTHSIQISLHNHRVVHEVVFVASCAVIPKLSCLIFDAHAGHRHSMVCVYAIGAGPSRPEQAHMVTSSVKKTLTSIRYGSEILRDSLNISVGERDKRMPQLWKRRNE